MIVKTKRRQGRKLVARRLTKKNRLEELRAFLQICFTVLNEDTEGDMKEISNLTGLSVTTIWRLQTDRFTLCVRFGTVQAIGAAAGFKLDWTEYGARMRPVG